MLELSDLGQQLRLWADELRALANEGLHWDRENPYNVRRFERVRCRTALRVWHRDLGRLKRALEYAHSLR